jgi:hypothetical protein
MQIHPTEPMRYGISDKVLEQLREDAGYEIPITHYVFRRWTANEVNCKSPQKSQKGQPNVCSRSPSLPGVFIDQERNRILNHSGTRIFEKYCNDYFIHCDVKSVVLLRPQQA